MSPPDVRTARTREGVVVVLVTRTTRPRVVGVVGVATARTRPLAVCVIRTGAETAPPTDEAGSVPPTERRPLTPTGFVTRLVGLMAAAVDDGGALMTVLDVLDVLVTVADDAI